MQTLQLVGIWAPELAPKPMPPREGETGSKSIFQASRVLLHSGLAVCSVDLVLQIHTDSLFQMSDAHLSIACFNGQVYSLKDATYVHHCSSSLQKFLDDG